MILKCQGKLVSKNVLILIFGGICCFFSFRISLSANLPQDLILSDRCQILLNEIIENYFTDYSPNEIEIDILPGGHSTNGVTNLLIIAGQKKYVLRMKAEELSNQWLECEYYAMEEAAKIGLSPVIYFTSSDHRAILMEHIEANTLTVADANRSENCIAIAHAISKAHAINQNPHFGISEDENVENIFLEICTHPEISAQVKEAFDIIKNCKEKL